ncbi:MAG: DUF3192 domain-containing protein [Alphaproteobacteria bacterium]
MDHSADYCPPSLRTRAEYLTNNLKNVPYGADTTGIVETLGRPEQYRRVTVNNGQKYDVWLYRTGYEKCRHMPTTYEFTPVVFHKGHVIGHGMDYVTTYVRPFVVADVQIMTGNEFRTGMADAINYAAYPFSKAF